MTKIYITTIALIAMIITSCSGGMCKQRNVDAMQGVSEIIFEKGERITNTNFTGNAWLNSLIEADSLNQNSVGSVTFEPGARTHWHSHPAGQIILALSGVGYYQEKDKPIEIIKKGDVVKCPHNVPHWHGASPDNEFIQVAITGRENGPTVWYNPVSDEEYRSIK